jgi:hypothetical protein
VDESRAVLERLQRIELLDRGGAGPVELVAELRALLVDAESWSRREGGEAGESAVRSLRDALGSMQSRGAPTGLPSPRDP